MIHDNWKWKIKSWWNTTAAASIKSFGENKRRETTSILRPLFSDSPAIAKRKKKEGGADAKYQRPKFQQRSYFKSFLPLSLSFLILSTASPARWSKLKLQGLLERYEFS